MGLEAGAELVVSLNARRLERYLLACARTSRFSSWHTLDVARLSFYLGMSRATFYRALKDLRGTSTHIQTITYFDHGASQKGNWRVMWSATDAAFSLASLHFLDSHGRTRHLRNSLRCPNITPSESHPVVRETTSNMITPGGGGRGSPSPKKLARKSWAIARELQRLHTLKPWQIDFDVYRARGWIRNGLCRGLDGDAIIRGYAREMDSVHAHNTDHWFGERDPRSRLKRRGAGWMARAALRYAERCPRFRQAPMQSMASYTHKVFHGSMPGDTVGASPCEDRQLQLPACPGNDPPAIGGRAPLAAVDPGELARMRLEVQRSLCSKSCA